MELVFTLTFNLLLTLLIEIPLVGFFFRRRKRKNAYMYAFIANIITWPVVNVIKLNWLGFNNNLVPDISELTIATGIVIAEGIIYAMFLECGWKKAFTVSFIVNLISLAIARFSYLGAEFFTSKKPDIIIH